MVRQAKAVDIPAIEELWREAHAASKYAARVEISDKVMRDTLMFAVAGQNQNGPQASFLHVAEQGGKVVGFMLGTLTRVYQVGTKLTANDVFLYVRKGAQAAHSLRLIDAYVAWAEANPKVIEIMLSWTDALPGAARVAAVYSRKGFERVGELFEMRRTKGTVG